VVTVGQLQAQRVVLAAEELTLEVLPVVLELAVKVIMVVRALVV
jgi:hypothetical protein